MQFEGFTHTAFALPLVALAFLAAPIAPADARETLTLEQHVLPILTKNCMGCHGGLRQKGGLDLRTPDSILAGGESGAALIRDLNDRGINTGITVGKTSDGGKNPGDTIEERPITAQDYMATLCTVLGIDPHKEFMGPGQRPMPLVDKKATLIKELLA